MQRIVYITLFLLHLICCVWLNISAWHWSNFHQSIEIESCSGIMSLYNNNLFWLFYGISIIFFMLYGICDDSDTLKIISFIFIITFISNFMIYNKIIRRNDVYMNDPIKDPYLCTAKIYDLRSGNIVFYLSGEKKHAQISKTKEFKKRGRYSSIIIGCSKSNPKRLCVVEYEPSPLQEKFCDDGVRYCGSKCFQSLKIQENKWNQIKPKTSNDTLSNNSVDVIVSARVINKKEGVAFIKSNKVNNYLWASFCNYLNVGDSVIVGFNKKDTLDFVLGSNIVSKDEFLKYENPVDISECDVMAQKQIRFCDRLINRRLFMFDNPPTDIKVVDMFRDKKQYIWVYLLEMKRD